MKPHKLLALGLAFASVATLRAQSQIESTKTKDASTTSSHRVQRLDTICRNYLRCLNSNVNGVVESALGHVTYLRIAYPDLEMGLIRNQVFHLAMKGANLSIRHKAYTALKVFSRPLEFRSAIIPDSGNGDGLFDLIAARMDRQEAP